MQNGGLWLVRIYLGGQRYHQEAIGTADDKPIGDDGGAKGDGHAVLDFGQACRKARERAVEFVRVDAGLPAKANGRYTVSDAVADYYKGAKDTRLAEARKLIITETGHIGRVELLKLTKGHIGRWLDKLAETPPRLRTRKGAKQQFGAVDGDEAQRKRKATANFYLNGLKAALNQAYAHERVGTDRAWATVMPFKGVNKPRARFLAIDECVRLVNAATPPEFRNLVKAALLTGARYNELASLDVADLYRDTLHIRHGKGNKERHILLNAEAVTFFKSVTVGRAASQPMLPKNGGRWGRSHQDEPMKQACRAASLTPRITFHGLRHTWASHAVMSGLPLTVVAQQLGHASTMLVERVYGHLAQNWIKQQVVQFAPNFGLPHEPTNVRRLRR